MRLIQNMISGLKPKTKFTDNPKYFLILVTICISFGLLYNNYYINIFRSTSTSKSKPFNNSEPFQKSFPSTKSPFQPATERNPSTHLDEWEEELHPELLLEQIFLTVDNISKGASHGSDSNYSVNTPSCKIPTILIFDQSFKREVNEDPKCSQFRQIATLNDKEQILELQGSFAGENCSVTEITKSENDAEFFLSSPEPLVKKHDLSKKELVFIRCGKDFNLEANFPVTPEVQKKIEYWKGKKALPINVLFFGFDTTSRADFHRSLPRTMNTAKEMGFLDFKGYHSIAPYSLENFLGFLVGLTTPSIRKTCAPSWSSSFDTCPHIWKYYSQNEFVTMYAEDGSQTFNWGGQGGFIKRPTDYYLHPMFRFLNNLQQQNPREYSYTGCFNQNQSVQNYLLEYQRRFVKKFEETPFFSFMWNNDATHDYTGKLAGMDSSINKLLLSVNSSEHLLHRTIIIMVSDHGRRYGDFDHQGKFLERSLPGLFIRLPEVLQEKFPKINFRNNMRFNTRMLTTGFDIYHTLKHLLVLQNMNVSESDAGFKPALKDMSSLLVPISGNRSCSDVNIIEGNCVCNTTGDIQAWENPYLRQKLIKFSFEELNGIIASSKYGNVCRTYNSPLMGYVTSRILRSDSNYSDGVLQFLTNGKIIFEVQFRVVHEHTTFDKIERRSKFIRNTAYGNTSWCVNNELDEDHMFKELCTCINE